VSQERTYGGTPAQTSLESVPSAFARLHYLGDVGATPPVFARSTLTGIRPSVDVTLTAHYVE